MQQTQRIQTDDDQRQILNEQKKNLINEYTIKGGTRFTHTQYQ
mgnify:CR=1 FL=1